MAVKHLNNFILICLIFLFFKPLSFAEEVDNLSGYYTTPGHCSSLNSNGKYVSCKKVNSDCLRLEKIEIGKVKVEVYSTQGLGSSCAVSGVAKIDGKKIFLNLSDEIHHQGLIINVKDKYLELEVVPKGVFNINCGVHASFQGLKFDRSLKKASHAVCFSG